MESKVVIPRSSHDMRNQEKNKQPLIVVVMGVAGSGKSTIGTMLAAASGCAFVDGDSLHSPENRDKMSRGIPLTDADRAPWLATIHEHISKAFNDGECLVVACSALKERYRQLLSKDIPVTWVYLKGSPELIRLRLEERPNHYMKPNMLPSQFHDLEEPADAIVAEIIQPPKDIVEQVLARLHVSHSRGA